MLFLHDIHFSDLKLLMIEAFGSKLLELSKYDCISDDIWTELIISKRPLKFSLVGFSRPKQIKSTDTIELLWNFPYSIPAIISTFHHLFHTKLLLLLLHIAFYHRKKNKNFTQKLPDLIRQLFTISFPQ